MNDANHMQKMIDLLDAAQSSKSEFKEQLNEVSDNPTKQADVAHMEKLINIMESADVSEAAPVAAAAGGAVARMAAKKGAGKMASKVAGGAATRATDSGIQKASKWAKDKLDQMAADDSELEEAAYETDLDPEKPVVVKGVKGMDSKPFTKKFRNQAAYDKWADSEEADDYDVNQVMNEACGDMPMQQPEIEDQTSITYSKTHNQGDASATVSATAKNLEELESVLRLAGVDPDLAQVHHAEPEPVAEPEPQPAMTFGTSGDHSYSTDAEFIRDQLRQRMQDYL